MNKERLLAFADWIMLQEHAASIKYDFLGYFCKVVDVEHRLTKCQEYFGVSYGFLASALSPHRAKATYKVEPDAVNRFMIFNLLSEMIHCMETKNEYLEVIHPETVRVTTTKPNIQNSGPPYPASNFDGYIRRVKLLEPGYRLAAPDSSDEVLKEVQLTKAMTPDEYRKRRQQLIDPDTLKEVRQKLQFDPETFREYMKRQEKIIAEKREFMADKANIEEGSFLKVNGKIYPLKITQENFSCTRFELTEELKLSGNDQIQITIRRELR